jgi:hypothetical protein
MEEQRQEEGRTVQLDPIARLTLYTLQVELELVKCLSERVGKDWEELRAATSSDDKRYYWECIKYTAGRVNQLGPRLYKALHVVAVLGLDVAQLLQETDQLKEKTLAISGEATDHVASWSLEHRGDAFAEAALIEVGSDNCMCEGCVARRAARQAAPPKAEA